MAALATGAAAAAGNTPAGTVISNTATASFEDPTNPGTQATPVSSNTVTSTVQPKPDFDVTYAGAPSSDGTTPTTPIASHDKKNVLPGATVVTQYTILNNGNVGSNTPAGVAYNVTVAPYLGGTTLPTGTVVQYWVGTTKVYDSSDTVTYPGIVSVPADDPTTATDEGQVALEQRILVPSSANPTADFSVSPRGNANVYSAGTIAATDEATTDLQYTRVRLYKPLVSVDPPSKDPNNPGTPLPTVVVPPSGPTGTQDPNYDPANPTTPVNPVSPPGTPGTTSDPKVTGYVDPTTTSTPIAKSGSNQIAYPTADTNTTDDVVTFVNTLTNTGMADTVNLFPTDSSGNPIGINNNDGSFLLPGGVVVRFLNNDGTAITTLYTDPATGSKYPTIALASGFVTPSTTDVRVQVTYPDSNKTATTDPAPVVVLVGIDSGNDSGVVADATSSDTIMPASMQFGDSNGTTLGVDNTVATATQTVDPTVAPASATTVAQNTTDRRAVFPMDLVNRGEYADSYTLTTATLSFPNTANGTSTATVRYVNASGVELAKDSSGRYISPIVGANDEITVYGIVDVPADALAGTVLVPQSATGNFSTILSSDNDDVIKISVVNTDRDPITGDPTTGMFIRKYQTKGATGPTGIAAEKLALTTLPGDTLRYKIVAKNNYNAAIKNFVLSDSATGSTNVYTYSDLVSVSATASFSGTVYYKVNGGAWSTTAPVAGTVITSLQVAVDTNSDNVITATDTVPALGSVTLNIVVTVK
ncbi:hypothetical protein [Deinococcus sonorensis]|uniref:DUF11 domain-containing protein n=2 Tax=Deinococcus sonorensis TaxID=309891 RepID=A0AAU7UBW2_9DEIO